VVNTAQIGSDNAFGTLPSSSILMVRPLCKLITRRAPKQFKMLTDMMDGNIIHILNEYIYLTLKANTSILYHIK